jgi:hypothetical protein
LSRVDFGLCRVYSLKVKKTKKFLIYKHLHQLIAIILSALLNTGIALIYLTRDIQKQKGYLLLFMSILLHQYAGIAAAQSNSDYLESLEGEASGLTLDEETKTVQQSNYSAPKSSFDEQWNGEAGAIQELTPGLSIEQFEVVLKNNYIGSYLFYKRLDNSQKDQVFLLYQDNPDPKKIRELILQVSKK